MAKTPAPAASSTLDLIKQRFATLCAQRDADFAKVAPLRAERDKLVADAHAALAAQLAPLDEQIAAIEGPLVSTMREIAQVSIALNGQTA